MATTFEQIDINGIDIVFTPIPAIPMLKIAHRFGQALAREKALVGIVESASKALAPTTAGKDEEVSPEATKVLLGFVETVFLSVDAKLLTDFLAEAAKVIALPGNTARKGEALFAVFDGDVAGLVTCLYHVLRVSGFFGMLRVKA